MLVERESKGSIAYNGTWLTDIYTDVACDIAAGLLISKKGIDYCSNDKKPTYIFVLTAARHYSLPDDRGPYLKVLARISRLLKMTDFRSALLGAKNAQEISGIIHQYAEKLYI